MCCYIIQEIWVQWNKCHFSANLVAKQPFCIIGLEVVLPVFNKAKPNSLVSVGEKHFKDAFVYV